MTLITNEIHMLDGFKKTLILFAADRRLTYPDGSYAGTKQKLFPIPYLNGGISYFGLAEVYPKNKRRYLSEWLRHFITGHATTTKSLKDFAFQLRDDLHSAIPSEILEKNASGFHICGYNSDGLPEFWFLRNCDPEGFRYANLQRRYMEPRADFLDRDAKSLGWDGTNLTSIENKCCMYRNGDFRAHVVAFERLDKVLIDFLSFPDFNKPKKPEDWVRFKFEFVAYLYKKFAKREIIGRPIDAFCLTKTLP